MTSATHDYSKPMQIERCQQLPLSHNSTISIDHLWTTIQEEALRELEREVLLTDVFQPLIWDRSNLEDALAFHLAKRLARTLLPHSTIWDLFRGIFLDNPVVGRAIRADIRAVRERDAACVGYLQPFLYFKGFHALESYRACHVLWTQGRHALAFLLQSLISEVFGVDIHPAAQIGMGIFIDHATGVVIGETSVVEDNVSILHEVTLGGTGKEKGDRHPKIRRGVLIGAGAKILGNIEVGRGAKIGMGSVVLHHVPPYRTAVGVPARIVGVSGATGSAFEIDHRMPEENIMNISERSLID